jgi:hypothetical protein
MAGRSTSWRVRRTSSWRWRPARRDRRRRAKRIIQRGFAERLAYGGKIGVKLVPLTVEDGNIGALKGIDRLLPVTHHEQGPRLAAVAAFAREELARQRLHDLPLHGAGVLRLVDEQVLDAAIELEQHPGGIRLLAQEFSRPDDEVFEVIGSARALGRLEAMHDGGSQPQQ